MFKKKHEDSWWHSFEKNTANKRQWCIEVQKIWNYSVASFKELFCGGIFLMISLWFSDDFLCASEPKYLQFQVFAPYFFCVIISHADQLLIIINLILKQLHRIH